jgi:hypothetical protein
VLTALLERPAERDVVAAVDLVGLDAEALAGVTPRPRGREHAVVAAEEIARRHVRPRLEGPRLAERLRGLLAFSPPGLRGELGRDVVVEDVVVPGRLVAGVLPPVAKSSPGEGIIPATRTTSSTGRRAQTSGAVNPPSE